MDAPIHFGVGSVTIDALPPERFFGKAWVIEVAITHNQQLITESVMENVADRIEAGDSILLKSGWYRNHHEAKYRNALPRVSESFANWMVAKSINRLVVEPPSVADVNNLEEVTCIHKILLGGNVIIVEGICNTDELTADQVELVTLPLKIKDGDGAPARVIAVQK
jgi:kynurenine formamidase